jgi:hypothetical protein
MIIRQSTREVEDNGAESACRGIVNTACTRCIEAINTQYREEMQGRWLLLLEFAVIVAGEGDSCVKKKESAVAELNKRGSVQ